VSALAYRDSAAMWRALGDRAKTAAKVTGIPAQHLVRRFIYDRFLARVFADPTEPWVLKGGTAVLARVNDARHSKDIDLLRRLGDIDEALAALRAVCDVDLQDHFRFVTGAVRSVGGNTPSSPTSPATACRSTPTAASPDATASASTSSPAH